MKTILVRSFLILSVVVASFASADAKWIIYEGKSFQRIYPSNENQIRTIDRWIALDFDPDTGTVAQHVLFSREITKDGTHFGEYYPQLLMSRPTDIEPSINSSTLLLFRFVDSLPEHVHFHIALQGRDTNAFSGQGIAKFPVKFVGNELHADPYSFITAQWAIAYSRKLSNIANAGNMDMDAVRELIYQEMYDIPGSQTNQRSNTAAGRVESK